MIASFSRLTASGTYTIACSPSCSAAQAVAAPWFPVEAVTTVPAPAGSIGLERGEGPAPLERAELVQVLALQEEVPAGREAFRCRLERRRLRQRTMLIQERCRVLGHDRVPDSIAEPSERLQRGPGVDHGRIAPVQKPINAVRRETKLERAMAIRSRVQEEARGEALRLGPASPAEALVLEGRATREDCEDDRHTACRVRSLGDPPRERSLHLRRVVDDGCPPGRCVGRCRLRRTGVDEERLAGVRELRGESLHACDQPPSGDARAGIPGAALAAGECTEASFGLADETFDPLVIGNGQLARRLPGHGGREGDDRDLDPIPVELLEPAVEPMSVEIDLEASLVQLQHRATDARDLASVRERGQKLFRPQVLVDVKTRHRWLVGNWRACGDGPDQARARHLPQARLEALAARARVRPGAASGPPSVGAVIVDQPFRSIPSPGAAGTASHPSASGTSGSASMKSRRSGVQPGGS